MKTLVVFLNVDAFSNGRTIAEKIEGKSFKTTKGLLQAIKDQEKSVDVYNGVVTTRSLSEFMTEVNDGNSFEGYWTTFVYISE